MAKKIKKFDEGGMATDPNYMPSTTPEVAPAASKGPSADQIKAAMALATQGTKSLGGMSPAAGQGMGGMGGGSQAGRIVPAAPAAYKKGGAVKKEEMKMDKEQDKAMIKKAFKQHDMQEHKGGKGTSLKLKMGGMSGCGYKDGGMAKCATGGKVKKMAKGGGIEVRGKTRGRIC